MTPEQQKQIEAWRDLYGQHSELACAGMWDVVRPIIDALTAENAELVAALRAARYVMSYSHPNPLCVACSKPAWAGCDPDCPIGAILARYPDAPGTEPAHGDVA